MGHGIDAAQSKTTVDHPVGIDDPHAARAAEPAALLESPDASVGTMTDIALLIERHLTNRQRMADRQRDMALKSQEAADAREIDKMREEANDILKQAVTSGVLSLASAAAQGISVGLAFKAEAFRTKAAPDLEKVSKWDNAAAAASRQGVEVSADASIEAARSASAVNTIGQHSAELYGKAWEVGKTAFDGASRAADIGWQHAIKNDQVEQKRHSIASRSAGRAADSAGEESRSLHDLAEKTFSRLETLLQQVHQSRLATIQAMKV